MLPAMYTECELENVMYIITHPTLMSYVSFILHLVVRHMTSAYAERLVES